jgi:type II secretory pathway component PulM
MHGQEEDVMMGNLGIKLSSRDKRALVVGILILGIVLLFFGWISPRLERIKRLDRAIASETRRLEQVRGLFQAVSELNEREARIQEQMRKRTMDVTSVASAVESLAKETSVMEQVQYLKPEQAKVSEQFREASVALKMVEVTLPKLVEFLYRVESSERVLRVKNLQVRLNPKDNSKLDVSLVIFTLVPAGAQPAKSEESKEAEEVVSPSESEER